MDLNKPVSGRELARLTGQSEGAVRKARDRQSIIKGVTADGKYIPLIASNEWGKPIFPEFLNAKESAVPEKTKSVKPIPAVKKQKKEAETFEDIADEIMHEKLPIADADDLDDDTVSEELDDKIQKPEAERVTAVLKAKILQITFNEKKNELIPRHKINPILFGFGQEIRVLLEGMTNRILDNVLACENRHEAKRIMDEEIYSVLNEVADITKRQF